MTTHYDARIFAGRKFARLCKSWVVPEETSLKYSAGILIEERRGEKGESLLVFSWEQRGRYVMDDEGKRKEKKEKEEKFFWNDSVKPLEWNLQKFPVSPLPFTRKKSVVSRPQICYALFFREQRTERERKAGNRNEIIWKTRRKSTISLAIKNLVINKLIPLLSRARDFVCQLRMYKRNVAARNRCGLTAQLHSLSSSRWILFLVNELRSWISPYTFHFRGRYISLLHLVHPFPMKIIEQFRVNQLPFPKRLKDSKGRGKGMASSSFSFINTRGIEGTYIRIGVIFFNV